MSKKTNYEKLEQRQMSKKTSYEKLLDTLSNINGSQIVDGNASVTVGGKPQAIFNHEDGSQSRYTGRKQATIQRLYDEHKQGK